MEAGNSVIIRNLEENGLTDENKDLIMNLMLNGPPQEDRKLIWLEITGAAQKIKRKHNYYSIINNSSAGIDTESTRQIDRDIYRTFPEELYFRRQQNIKKLRNILVVYSVKNPIIGYCQGLNFIVGRLLTFNFTEEESF